METVLLVAGIALVVLNVCLGWGSLVQQYRDDLNWLYQHSRSRIRHE